MALRMVIAVISKVISVSSICIWIICLGCAERVDENNEDELLFHPNYSVVASDPLLGQALPHHHYAPWDLNDDGIVNIFDLIIVANHFGEEVKFYTVIKRVIDGDTVVSEVGDHIRYLGVNAPELQRNEPFSKEATDFNRELVLDKRVRLEFDHDELDDLRRPLAYLFLDDGRMVNEEMALAGWAKLPEEKYIKGIKYEMRFREAVAKAKEAMKGMWAK